MRSAKILERMKKRGLRVTQPRRVILDDLDSAKEYVSAEEIYLRIHPKHPKIGLATVYRTLTLLTQIGIVTKFEFGEGKARYEPLTDEHHDHLIDINTGEITEFVNEDIEKLQEQVAAKLGYKLVDHRLELYGSKIKK